MSSQAFHWLHDTVKKGRIVVCDFPVSTSHFMQLNIAFTFWPQVIVDQTEPISAKRPHHRYRYRHVSRSLESSRIIRVKLFRVRYKITTLSSVETPSAITSFIFYPCNIESTLDYIYNILKNNTMTIEKELTLST